MQYAAFLRGIGPGNPNMRGPKLCSVFERLGFTKVASVISSGNVVFETTSRNSAALEKAVEEALPKYLGFQRLVIIRSRTELQQLVKRQPFQGQKHGQGHYLIVSFPKNKRAAPAGVVCTAIDQTRDQPQEVMTDLERKYAKAVTTRTWLTVERVLRKMEEVATE